MQELIGLIKIILEKYLIKTLIAIIFVGIICLMTPDNSYVILKLGKSLYLMFIFAIGFIGCVSVEKISKKYKEYIEEKDYENKEKIINLEELWEFIDDISEEEFKIISNLIENNNKPVIVYNNSFDYEFYLNNSIFTGNILIMSNQKKENEEYEKFFIDPANPNNEEYLPYKICKLKNDTYELLKFSKKKYGRISNIK